MLLENSYVALAFLFGVKVNVYDMNDFMKTVTLLNLETKTHLTCIIVCIFIFS